MLVIVTNKQTDPETDEEYHINVEYDPARGESMDERIKYTQKFDNYVVDGLDIETYSLNWFDKEEFKEYIRLLI